MYMIGISRRHIARRLGYSEKHVGRIIKESGIEQRHAINDLLDSEYEHALWGAYLDSLKTYSRVAWCFGVSRQAVWEKLNNKEVAA